MIGFFSVTHVRTDWEHRSLDRLIAEKFPNKLRIPVDPVAGYFVLVCVRDEWHGDRSYRVSLS